MALDLANYESLARKAVRRFWTSRERAGVQAGKNMDGFLELMEEVVYRNGLSDAVVLQQRQVLTLPGYFRPTKLWDLLVLRNGRLIAALEFKSQVGPSFGNNFSNRTEEVVGTAVDLWTAYRENAFGEQPRSFLGWLILLEDAPASRKPVNNLSHHFPVFSDFRNASYAERYNVLCKKLVQEQLYSAACILTSPCPGSGSASGKYTEMSEITGLRTFVTEFAGHIATEARANKFCFGRLQRWFRAAMRGFISSSHRPFEWTEVRQEGRFCGFSKGRAGADMAQGARKEENPGKEAKRRAAPSSPSPVCGGQSADGLGPRC